MRFFSFFPVFRCFATELATYNLFYSLSFISTFVFYLCIRFILPSHNCVYIEHGGATSYLHLIIWNKLFELVTMMVMVTASDCQKNTITKQYYDLGLADSNRQSNNEWFKYLPCIYYIFVLAWFKECIFSRFMANVPWTAIILVLATTKRNYWEFSLQSQNKIVNAMHTKDLHMWFPLAPYKLSLFWFIPRNSMEFGIWCEIPNKTWTPWHVEAIIRSIAHL